MTRSCHTEQKSKKRLNIVKMTTNNTIHRIWLLFIILSTQSTFCKQFTSVIVCTVLAYVNMKTMIHNLVISVSSSYTARTFLVDKESDHEINSDDSSCMDDVYKYLW